MQTNYDDVVGKRPLLVFTTCHSWIQAVVAAVQPPDIDVCFLDINDVDAVVEDILPQADFLVCLTLNPQQAQLLHKWQLVMHNGVGYDAIAVETLREMGIPVAITPAMTPEGVAEHTLMLILVLYKQLPAVQQSMRSGEWNMFVWRQGSHNLAGKTVGIVGLGRIGKRVAHLAYAFGCKVIYNDILPMPRELEQRLELQRVDLDTLLTQGDIVTLHVPLTVLTEGMISATEFGRMPSNSLFINTSRGKTYDLDALYDALISGHLLGAGLDVYDPEPPSPEHPLLQLPNVICTPHIASGTVERQYAINRAQFANCQRVLASKRPHDLI